MIKTADWIESNAKNCAQACVEGKNRECNSIGLCVHLNTTKVVNEI